MIGRVIDRVVVYGSHKKDGKRGVEYSAYSIVTKDASKLCVVLPPWHIAPRLWKKFQNNIIEQGYSLVVVEAAENILVPDPAQIVRNFQKVRQMAIDEIEKVRKIQPIDEIDLVGMSLGSVSALYLAVSGLVINKMILLAPSDDLGEGIWYGTRTTHIRSVMERAGTTLEEFQAALNELTLRRPVQMNITELHVYLSKDDDVIPYQLGLRLIRRCEELGLSVRAIENKWRGHYMAFVLFCLKGKI